MRNTFIFCLLISYFFISCKPLQLLPPKVTLSAPISNFKYVVITNTGDKNSSAAAVYGRGFSRISSSVSNSVNPKDIISGILMRRGFTILPETKNEFIDQTLIVNYGESGKRNTGYGSYAMEVTISFVSAKTFNTVATCSAEGRGKTESEDIRIAITRCLDFLPSK